jgi:hypothetical protein
MRRDFYLGCMKKSRLPTGVESAVFPRWPDDAQPALGWWGWLLPRSTPGLGVPEQEIAVEDWGHFEGQVAMELPRRGRPQLTSACNRARRLPSLSETARARRVGVVARSRRWRGRSDGAKITGLHVESRPICGAFGARKCWFL